MILATPLGKWTKAHSTNGIWTFYESDNKVFEYVVPVGDTAPTEIIETTVAMAVTDDVTAVTENVTDVTENVTAVTENVIGTAVTENDTTLVTATNSNDDQPIAIDTSVKHWNVYVKHGSSLNRSRQCGFNEFDPTTAVPIPVSYTHLTLPTTAYV